MMMNSSTKQIQSRFSQNCVIILVFTVFASTIGILSNFFKIIPLGLSPVVLLHVGVAEVRTQTHDGQPLLVACPGGDLDLVHVQTVQEVNEEGIIHRLSQEFCSISSPTVIPTEGELIRLLLFALY